MSDDRQATPEEMEELDLLEKEKEELACSLDKLLSRIREARALIEDMKRRRAAKLAASAEDAPIPPRTLQ